MQKFCDLARARGDLATSGRVDGRIDIQGLRLDVLAALFPDRLDGLSGRLDSVVSLAGPAARPRIDGTVSLVELYLPSNIFYSLANNLVPAVVLFSILMGFALISVEDKDYILSVFEGLANALAHINKAGAHLQSKLAQLSAEFGLGKTRGSGLLIALDLGQETGPEIVAKAMENGLLLNAPRSDTLRFMPALNVSLDEIDEAVSILDLVLSEMA